ncbi:MAG: MerR family transcriptional regulator, glutamine synthetase repressor [Bacillota bacterium]|nr:MerR family transcriptional regulator, glutamine synthetase repressor [Bacillota bacterium]
MGDVDQHTPVYPIGVVRQLTGLTDRQIRYYEETGLVIPARTAGHQRLYSPWEVERLKEIRDLLAEGFTIKTIKALFSRRGEKPPARHTSLPYEDAEVYFRAAGQAGRSVILSESRTNTPSPGRTKATELVRQQERVNRNADFGRHAR